MKRIVILTLGVFLSITSMAIEPTISYVGVDDVVRSWPAKSSDIAQAMIVKYGPPNDYEANQLMWNNKGYWRKIEVHQAWPEEGSGPILRQTIALKVPATRRSELTAFSNQLEVNEAGTEVTASSGREEENILLLNLATDILKGRTSLSAASTFLEQALEDLREGKKVNYTSRLKTN